MVGTVAINIKKFAMTSTMVRLAEMRAMAPANEAMANVAKFRRLRAVLGRTTKETSKTTLTDIARIPAVFTNRSPSFLFSIGVTSP